MGFGGRTLRLIQSMYKNDSIRFLINGKLTAPLYLVTGVKQGTDMEHCYLDIIKVHLGCNLSPLLFAIFIDGLRKLLQDTNLGVSLKLLIISILFFADDLALFAPTRKKLKKLIMIVRKYFKEHKLTLSIQKSKIMSQEADADQFEIEGDTELENICLDQVMSFKYLGVPFNSSPHAFFTSFNHQVKQRAQSYTYQVLSLVKSGPNRAELAYTLDFF